jgi:Icc protein
VPVTRILQLTDLHIFQDAQATLKGIPTRQTLDDVLQHILRNEPQSDQVVITGDHTHDELPASYEAVRTALHPWIDRLWQVPGNHDDRAVLRQVFADRIADEGQPYIRFRFESGNWTCVGLDTHVPGEVFGRIEQDQINWLKEVLDSTDSPVAIFLHHPPLLVGSPWMDAIGLHGRQLLQQVVEQSPQIKLICFGHVHHEFEFTLGNATVVSTPSTGIQFDPAGETPNFSAEAPGYRIIELNSNDFQTQVVRLPHVRYTPTTN